MGREEILEQEVIKLRVEIEQLKARILALELRPQEVWLPYVPYCPPVSGGTGTFTPPYTTTC